MTEDNSGLFDDSRRSFMKKGALATTAIALGAGATAGTSAAQEDNGNGNDVAVFGEDYLPGVDFDVAAQADTGTRDEVYEAVGLDDEFSDPDDWDLFFISYDTGGSAPTLGYLMVDNGDLSAGDSDTMGTDGSFRNTELNLVEATLGAEADEPDDEEEEEDEPEEPDEPDEPDEPGNGNGPDDGPGGD
jgi:hypothetical protein